MVFRTLMGIVPTAPVVVVPVLLAPVITSNGGGPSASLSVAENTTAVTTVTAVDLDTAIPLVYSMSGGADAGQFTINASTGVLTFTAARDFEVPTDADGNNVYEVVVRVSDGVLFDTQTLAVTVTNVVEVVVGVEFGALTKAASGGVLVSGTSITSGDASGHWQIIAGVLTPSTAGDTADLNLGPYSLVFNDTSTITLNIIAGAYSVADIDQLEVAAEQSSLTLGQKILMRGGAYNPTYLDKRITRTTAVNGTFTGANYVVFKPHTGEVVDLHRLGIYGTNFQNCYFEFTGMRMVPAGGNSAYGCIKTVNNASYVYVHDTTSNTPVTAPAAYATLSACFYSTPNTGAGKIRIENNVWDTCFTAIVASGNDLVIKGNTLTRMFEDAIKLTPPLARGQVVGNIVTNKQQGFTGHAVTAIARGATTVITLVDVTGITVGDDVFFYDLIGCTELSNKYNISALNATAKTITLAVNSTAYSAYISGGVANTTGVHGDYCQVSAVNAIDGELDDMVFRGNQFSRGAGTPGTTDGQGFFLQDNKVGIYFRRLLIEGNIIETTMQSGISIQNPLNAVVRNNVVIQKLGHSAYARLTRISFAGTGTGNTCYDNVSNDFQYLATVETQAGNVALTAGDAAAYAAAFVGPLTGEGQGSAAAAYAPKAGGVLATATPITGALPHQVFVSPWGFTNPRP